MNSIGLVAAVLLGAFSTPALDGDDPRYSLVSTANAVRLTRSISARTTLP
jgi:hypothetical protein